MDSISQMALGAALGEAVLGRRIGRTAMLAGAALGTLPDLDVLVRYADAIDGFTRHRGWSHSLFVLTVASPLVAAALHRYVPRLLARRGPARAGAGYARWLVAVWLILVTHALLDAFTLYGTQLWWPLPARPVAIGSIFIVDPLYTLPLLAGLLWAWRTGGARGGRVANLAGLAVSTAYLALTLLVQSEVRAVAERALARQGIEPSRVLVAPFPLSMLWRVVALDGERYLEGYRSLLDDTDDVRFVAMPRGAELLEALAEHPPVARLAWFTGSLLAAEARADTLVASDLRMGIESSYVFEFVVAERDGEGWRAIVPRAGPIEMEPARLAQLVRRTWDETVEIDRGDRRGARGGASR